MILVQTLKTKLFVCANVGNRDVSLLLPWLFVDDAMEEHCWNLENFDGNFFDLHCFCCVNLWITAVYLLLHRWLFDVSLKNRWSYSEDFDASINDLQGFYWLNLGNVDVSLLLRRWFFAEPLMKLRIFGCKRFWSLKFLMCWSSNFDSSLQLH